MLDFLHRSLRWPYKLHYQIENPTQKATVIFLHGLASDIGTWNSTLKIIQKQNYRTICIDLAGFGKSPKPNWPEYDVEFHTRQVIYTINKIGVSGPVVMVGHSMGSLIAVNIALKKPSLIKGLVLYGAPIYKTKEIKDTIKQYQLSPKSITNILFKIYDRIIVDKDVTLARAQKLMKVAPKYNSFKLSQDTWIPFKKSLTNCIMKQNTYQTCKKLKTPITFINGITDLLIINNNQKELAKIKPNIKIINVAGGHMITPLTAITIAKISKKYQDLA